MTLPELRERVAALPNPPFNPRQKRVSFSQYTLWQKCPSQWERQYRKKEAVSPPSISTSFGTGFHGTLQGYLQAVTDEGPQAADARPLDRELYLNLFRAYQQDRAKLGGQPFATDEQLASHYNDGLSILRQVQHERERLFPADMVATEVQLNIQFFEDYNVPLVGFIDGLTYHQPTFTLGIDDYKTSNSGWSRFEKSDPIKRAQLLFYVEGLSRLLNIPADHMEARFIVFALQPVAKYGGPLPARIEEVLPTTQGYAREEALDGLRQMITSCFLPSGQYSAQPQPTKPSKFACGYCPFKDSCPDAFK